MGSCRADTWTLREGSVGPVLASPSSEKGPMGSELLRRGHELAGAGVSEGYMMRLVL